MKSYRTLAFKEIRAQKITSILILVAIILSTMMTTAVGQSVGILAAMREQQAVTIGGNSYATFIQMNEKQVKALQNDERLSYTGLSIILGTIELNSSLRLGLSEYLQDSLETYPTLTRLKEGRLPEKAMEIALPEDILLFLGFTGEVGDPIILPLSKVLRHGIQAEAFDFEAEFILTGILKSNYLGYAAGSVNGIVGVGTAKTLLPDDYIYYNVDIRTAEKRTFQSTMDDLISKLQVHELDTMYNALYLDTLGIAYNGESTDVDVTDTGFSFMMVVGILVAALVLLAAGLVIYNILKITVSRRIRQYGTLRAIGAEKGHLNSIVVTEILLLCVVGIHVGMLFGFLSAKGILTAAINPLSPDVFLVQDAAQLDELIAENSSGKGIFLLLSSMITLLFAFFATVPAAHYAAKVSPVVAMSGTNVRIKRKKRSVKRIRSFERYYARLNLKRNRGRTAITVLSLVMSITVFITLQGFVSSLSVTSSADESHMGDYSLENEGIGFSADDLTILETDENVESVAAMQFFQYPQDEYFQPDGITLDFALQTGEYLQMVGLNDVYWDAYFVERLSPDELDLLKSGMGCVVRNPLPLVIQGEAVAATDIQKGSTITVAGKKLTVLEAMDGYDGYFSVGNNGLVFGIQIIVSDSLYSEMTGINTYAELFPSLKEGADREMFDNVLDELCQRVPGTTCLSYELADKQLAESASQINLLAWGLILFIGLIGILNIINTVYTNIHTRVTEIGTQRAIGMCAGSLYKSFLWEGAFYGIIAAIIGSVTGYIFTVLIDAANQSTIRLVSIPVVPIVEATIFAIVACLIATCIPLWKITKLSIVESIEAVE